MKRYIKCNSMVELWKEYYAEDAVDMGIIDESEIDDVLAIKTAPEFTEEDYDLFVAGITEYFRPRDIARVSYAMSKGEKAGFDGGYRVKLKDGSSHTYGWYFGKTDLTEI